MRTLYWSRFVSCPSPTDVSTPSTRLSQRWPATFKPSHDCESACWAVLPLGLKAGPQFVKSFGSGIRSIKRWTHPEGSIPGLLGSLLNTLMDWRSVPFGLTGLPNLSTVGLLDKALPFCAPGKNLKLP